MQRSFAAVNFSRPGIFVTQNGGLIAGTAGRVARASRQGLFRAAVIFLLVGAVRPVARASESSPTRYLGDEGCISCHRDKVNSYRRTAHSLTSQLADRDSVHGSFSAGSNILKTVNTNLYFEMTANDEGLFQTAWLRRPPNEIGHHTERFGIAIGSGRKGQTYAASANGPDHLQRQRN